MLDEPLLQQTLNTPPLFRLSAWPRRAFAETKLRGDRIDQVCAGVSALQFVRLKESSRRVATALRGVNLDENRSPEHSLIPKKTVH